MGGLRTCRTDPTTDWPKNPPMTQMMIYKNIHKSLISGGYEGGKHGNSKILQRLMLNPEVSL